MSFVSRGFRGRRREDADPSRVPPGQYVTGDFPVLSAGPTPHTSLEEWTFSIAGEVDEPRRWTWEEFRALPSEEVTVDIHCVTKWSKLDTTWEGVSRRHAARRDRDERRIRHRVVRRRVHDEPSPGGRARRERVGRLRVRRRAARSGARRAGSSSRPAPLLLEEREVGAWARAASSRTSPGSGRATGTTTTGIHGESSGTGATDLAARNRGRARRRDATRQEHRPRVPEWPGHRAGQHVDVRLTAEDGYQAQRSYSIASAPEDERLVLTVERLEDGEVSSYLVEELRPGDGLELRGPVGGYFVWESVVRRAVAPRCGRVGCRSVPVDRAPHRAVESDVPSGFSIPRAPSTMCSTATSSSDGGVPRGRRPLHAHPRAAGRVVRLPRTHRR